jgi:hypothetical protein
MLLRIYQQACLQLYATVKRNEEHQIKNRTRLSCEQLEGYMRIAAATRME